MTTRPLYIHGYIKAGVTADDSCCKHLSVGQTAYRFVIQQSEKKSDRHYLCLSCHESMMAELYRERVRCNDCNKSIEPDVAIPWSPYDANPADPAFHLCPDCECSTKHLNRVEQDRAEFEGAFATITTPKENNHGTNA